MIKQIPILICLFTLYTGLKSNEIPAQLKFERFPYPEKLPSNSVIRIYNDKDGYMWFGTEDGLCRFDGYDVKIFRSSALTPGKLTNNEIQCITEDHDNKIWVGTLEGVVIIDKKNFLIKHFELPAIKKERINSLLFDSEGFIWIGTSSMGAFKVDPITLKYQQYTIDKNSPLKLRGNSITYIYEDISGQIWFCSWKNGLCYIDKTRKKITYAPNIGKNNNPFRLYQDKDGLYWLCTWGDGIYNIFLDEKSNIKINPVEISKNPSQNSENIVYSITQDDTYGYIWIVTFRGGLWYIEKNKDGNYNINETTSFFEDSSIKLFHEIVKDRQGNLWLGTVGEGLYKLDFKKLAFQNFSLDDIKKTINVPSYITRVCELSPSDILIILDRIGIFHFNPNTGILKRPTDSMARSLQSITVMIKNNRTGNIWMANQGEDLIYIFKKNDFDQLQLVDYFSTNNTKTPRENNITNLFEDSKGNVWIGTSEGLYIKPLNAPVKLVNADFSYVMSISEDAQNRIWIGTAKEGVFISNQPISQQKTNFTFSNIDLKIKNYQSYSIQSICCKKNGDVYIGTKEGCLFYYNPKVNLANDISGLYGITDESILDILEDNNGVLWISTVKRIIKFNPQTQASTYFSNADGLLITMFFKNATIKLKSGQLLFGGNNGICILDPATYSNTGKPRKQKVLITDINIQNVSIFDDDNNKHYNSESNRVTLQHTESNISIEFSALDYASANKIQYAYMLSGVDNHWTYVGNNRRFVNYANLPPSKYEFLVKASDENGLWSDQITSLEILILPPPYKTWWAYTLYILVLLSAAYFIARMVANRIRLRNELAISHIEKEKSEELAQIKLRYFTNISHELLTPLTIIILLIDRLKKNSSDALQFEMLKTNANRLKRLIQQILVFRKTESGNIKLKISENDIIAFVNNICHSNFHPLIVEKRIKFTINSDYETFLAWFDPDKLDKVLYNLLSNAFKYTPKGGEISVKMSFISRENATIMRLSVSDTGCGISDDDLPHIFKRFYTSSKSDPSQSHGIGLSLTYDLIQIHKGNIEVKSQIGEGTVFTIEIPVSKEVYSPEDLSEEEGIQNIDLPEMADVITLDMNLEGGEAIVSHEDYTILIVEDNRELKNLIVDNFAKKYNVISAENGKEAMDLMRNNEVNLVISDVMMPEMDGLTLCRYIKNDVNTSHISVLMLTARNSTEDRIECYNAGADAYIAKPFEMKLLLARAKNLISKRSQKTENFRKNQEINISSMEYGSIDEDFLKQAVLKVELHLSDVSFDFDQFALDLGTSKSTLHRKLKSLTGLAPGEFIRNIRLKHASKMILNNTGNISDIAYAVGFNDPKYFAKCFKTEFGLTPTEYMESNSQQK